MNITHLIVGLGKGGAETMLYQFLVHTQGEEMTHNVISMGAADYYEGLIRELGIDVLVLPFRKHPVRSAIQLVKALRKTDLLSTWMYHANLVGFVAGKIAGVKTTIWNVRHASIDPALDSKRTLQINRICAKLSNKVACIAYNGEGARKAHEAIGYVRENGVVLPNGVDRSVFFPIEGVQEEVSRELGLRSEQKIVLSLTRNHPIKDVPTFLSAFSVLHSNQPETVAVLCGNGITETNTAIVEQCQKLGLQIGRDLFLLGLRHDVPRLLSACDLYVLHSAGEAFPNVLVQAMACGCLCLTTDVGDAAQILNQPDCVVAPQNVQELASKMGALLRLDSKTAQEIRTKNLIQVQQHYGIDAVIAAYRKLYETK